jgi:hypothetical protein
VPSFVDRGKVRFHFARQLAIGPTRVHLASFEFDWRGVLKANVLAGAQRVLEGVYMKIWHHVQLSRYLIFSVRGWRKMSRHTDSSRAGGKGRSEAGGLSKKVSHPATQQPRRRYRPRVLVRRLSPVPGFILLLFVAASHRSLPRRTSHGLARCSAKEIAGIRGSENPPL